MKNLKKLLPGGSREPKIIVVIATRREDCDRLIRHICRMIAGSPVAKYPIHAYCLQKPYEADRCARVVVDPDARRLYRQAEEELLQAWVALSATSWNGARAGRLLKLLPLMMPPFRGVIGNENGDFFPLKPWPVMRHLANRTRQQWHELTGKAKHACELRVLWPLRHFSAWLQRKTKDKVVWGTAVGLGKMAWFAQRAGPITHSAFRRLEAKESPGTEAGPRLPVLTSASGITRIEYLGRDWRHLEITKMLRESKSRWVLFCPPGYTEAFDDLLPPFEDPYTFAVTRQSGYREWRPVMVAASPFRGLQAKEASRVAAPLALMILADRKKLLELMLPDSMVFGAAWLTLFRRAGAAGWHSYSVGSGHPVPQQQDSWLEEMLFVKQLYRDAGLQRQRIQDPLLSRGNIAFRPDLKQPYRPLPRVLVVAPYLPFPLSHGGAVRIYNLCKSLASKVDFILICFREVNDYVDYEELHKIFRQVYVVDRDEIHDNPELPKQVNHYESSSMRALIQEIASREKVDLLQIEYTDLAAYREAAPGVPAILVEHDLTYTLHRQFTERDQAPAVVAEYQKWLRFETERLRAFSSIFVMSGQDYEEATQAGASRGRTYVIPNGVDLTRFRALPIPTGETEIFYVGSFRHLPNFLGFEELRTKIMPAVWERFPHAKLRVIAGPEHETHWRTALKGAAIPHLDPRIIVHGFVSDLLPLYESAHIVAVPLPLSAGTNIKVMEAMSCRRAVVTTPVGAQGLGLRNGVSALICGLGDDFARAIAQLIENPKLRDEIADAGRKAAEERFSWDAIGWDALETYSVLIREARAKSATGNGSQRKQDEADQQRDQDEGSESRRVVNKV